MKCRVCGYELPEDRTYCPMCGTKVYTPQKRESFADEMAWNTKDFPKPRKMEDIEMNWGNMESFMKRDASEGFANVDKDAPQKQEFNWNSEPKKSVDFEIPPFMQQSFKAQPASPACTPRPAYTPQPAYTQPVYAPQSRPAYAPQPQPAPVQQPVHQPAPAPQPIQQTIPQPVPQSMPDPKPSYWYEQNFTASGIMKTGPAVPLPQERPQPVYTPQPQPAPAPQPIRQPAPSPQPMPQAAPMQAQQPAPWDAKDVLQSAMPDATIAYVRVDQPRKVTDYTKAYPDYSSVTAQEQKRPEEFYTFQAKNEEFQKLLDQEYQKMKSMKDTFVPEASVKAQDISDFERSLFGEPQPAYPIEQREQLKREPQPAYPIEQREPQPELQIISKQEEASQKEEVKAEETFREKNTGSINLEELISDPLDPRFDIDTLEMTIHELKELDEKEEGERSERKERLARMEAARDAYFAFLDQKEAEEKGEKEPGHTAGKNGKAAEPDKTVSDATKIDLDDTKPEMNPALVGLYDYVKEEDDDEEKESGHGFLKFLGVIVIIIAVLELALLVLKHFLPDAGITIAASQVEAVVVQAIIDAAEKAWAWIQSLIAKIKG